MIKFCEIRSVSEHFGVWYFQAMQGSLGMCPFKLTLLLPEILLPCEGNLRNKQSIRKQENKIK